MSGTITPISNPVALVAEDGTGKSNANSYLSVAGANTYHATFTGSTDWAAATASTKELALIRATQYVDARFHGQWRGFRANEGQSLVWPRFCAEDDDGYAIDDGSVPQKLAHAVAELALRVVLGDDLLGVVAEPGTIASESSSVGPLSESVTYLGGKPHGYQYPRVEALLRGLLLGSDRVVRG
jgi:hypothetical protein